MRQLFDARPADGFANERRHIDGFGRLLRRAAGVVEKLAHDRIHLDQIGDHRRTGFGGQLSHFELESQSRQRRAQVMRDSRQQHGAVLPPACPGRRPCD